MHMVLTRGDDRKRRLDIELFDHRQQLLMLARHELLKHRLRQLARRYNTLSAKPKLFYVKSLDNNINQKTKNENRWSAASMQTRLTYRPSLREKHLKQGDNDSFWVATKAPKLGDICDSRPDA